MFGIQPIHIIIIVIVAFLIFGGDKLPELGRSAGKAISEFRKGAKEMTDSFRGEMNQPVESQAVSPTIKPPSPSIPAVPTVSTPPAFPKTPAATPAGRFCIQCGAPNQPEANFCGNCGTKLPEKGA